MGIKTIKTIKKINGKRVLLRADFNVPVKDGVILDDYKIIKTLPTLRYLLRYKCKIVIISHLGRPKPGSFSDFSLLPVAKFLGKILDKNVQHIDDCLGFQAGTAVGKMQEGEIVVLENLRFYEGEKKNSKVFAKKLSKLADIYVNDAFGVSHRAHASLDAIKHYLPSYAGLLLEKEIKSLNRIFTSKKPLTLIIGGAKIKTKLPLIKTFHNRADKILIGGALANNFLKANGFEIGKSLIDKESLKFAKKYKNKNLLLPIDAVVSHRLHNPKPVVKKLKDIGKNDYIFDIGPETIKLFSLQIKKANSLIWNGPLGYFEEKGFRSGTEAIAHIYSNRSRGKAYGVAGGGETVEALQMTDSFDDIDWVSTGGGAMLSYLGGMKMPGLKKIL